MDKLLKLGNGKKTLFGVLLFFVMALICFQTGFDIPNFEEPGTVADMVKILGLVLGVLVAETGWADKIAKARTEELKRLLLQESPHLQTGENAFKDVFGK